MNALYDYGREGFLDGSISWTTSDVRVMLVRDTYTFSAAHQFVSDLGAVDNGRSGALTGKSATDGVADAADVSLFASNTATCDALILFVHTGLDASARLIVYLDSASAGLPVSPLAGQGVDVVWDNGADRIFRL